MSFQKALRQQAKLRLALTGPSGSGKTYSALLIAQGLAPGGRIALIDTERGSGELYAHLADYDVATFAPPFTPARYAQFIREAETGGYDVLIIDSLSHEWAGTGGILDRYELVAATKSNKFSVWAELTPQHNALLDALLRADLHVIVTLRTKTAYEIREEDGKKKPVKLGLAPVQRDGIEYEFTLVLDLAVDQHVATVSKDRTQLFDGRYFVPSRETGATLREWLASGLDAAALSQERLNALRTHVDGITNLPHLENWWRAHKAEIEALRPADQEALTAHCASRKAAILQERSAAPASAPGGDGKTRRRKTPAPVEAPAPAA